MGNSYGYIPDGLDFYIVCACCPFPSTLCFGHRFLTREKVETKKIQIGIAVNNFASIKWRGKQRPFFFSKKRGVKKNHRSNTRRLASLVPATGTDLHSAVSTFSPVPFLQVIIARFQIFTCNWESKILFKKVIFVFWKRAWETSTWRGSICDEMTFSFSKSRNCRRRLHRHLCSWCGEFECADKSPLSPSPGVPMPRRPLDPIVTLWYRWFSSRERERERNLLSSSSSSPFYSRTLNSLLFKSRREREKK